MTRFQPYLVRTWHDQGRSQLKILDSLRLLTLPILRQFWAIRLSNCPSRGSLTYILIVDNKLHDLKPTLIESIVDLNPNPTPIHLRTTLDDVKKNVDFQKFMWNHLEKLNKWSKTFTIHFFYIRNYFTFYLWDTMKIPWMIVWLMIFETFGYVFQVCELVMQWMGIEAQKVHGPIV